MWYIPMDAKSKRKRIFTVALRHNFEKWNSLRKEMGVDSYGDPGSYSSNEAYFKARDEHLQKFRYNPDYQAQYLDKLVKFYVEWERLSLPLAIDYGHKPDPIERELFHRTAYVVEDEKYTWVHCEWCGHIFGSKTFSTKRYCSPECKRNMNNHTRNSKKGVIQNKICANPKCQKTLENKRAGAKTCSPACRQAIKRL